MSSIKKYEPTETLPLLFVSGCPTVPKAMTKSQSEKWLSAITITICSMQNLNEFFDINL